MGRRVRAWSGIALLLLVACGPLASLVVESDGEGGRVEVAGVLRTLPWEGAFPRGSEVELRAVPGSGFGFLGWAGDASGDDNPIRVTVDGTRRVVARFGRDPVAEATPAHHDFGAVPVGAAEDRVFSLANVGGGVTATVSGRGTFDGDPGPAPPHDDFENPGLPVPWFCSCKVGVGFDAVVEGEVGAGVGGSGVVEVLAE